MPTWPPDQLALLGTMPDPLLAAQLGREVGAVRQMRTRMGIQAFNNASAKRKWSRREITRLGKVADGELAAQLGIARKTVIAKRKELGVKPFSR